MSAIPTITQYSAGGVAYRKENNRVEIALIKTSVQGRWQLPKGGANAGEDLPTAALREVREETGIVTDLLCILDRIEFWYAANVNTRRTRYHKYVTFYLMKYRSGSVLDHDNEVIEARWVEINAAIAMLSFESERQVVRAAQQAIVEREQDHTVPNQNE
jgi:8-oxo-dGTP diphosphatase